MNNHNLGDDLRDICDVAADLLGFFNVLVKISLMCRAEVIQSKDDMHCKSIHELTVIEYIFRGLQRCLSA